MMLRKFLNKVLFSKFIGYRFFRKALFYFTMLAYGYLIEKFNKKKQAEDKDNTLNK